MQFDASTFSDPAMRPQLEQYYEAKKAALVASLKERGDTQPQQVSFKLPDGTEQTGTAIPMSAEFVEKALVSFDKWLEFQAESFEMFGPDSLAMAEQQMERMQANHPDSASGVRSTFSSDGTLLAYVTADGGLATSNGADFLQSLAQKADTLGLGGQERIDFLTKEIEKALSSKYSKLDIATYGAADSPSKREFAAMWHPDFDVDQHYAEGLAEAEAQMESAMSWHRNWERNMGEIRSFLLSMQEAA